MHITLSIFVMPFVKINIEDNNSAGFQSAQDESLIGGDGDTSGWAVRLLKRY